MKLPTRLEKEERDNDGVGDPGKRRAGFAIVGDRLQRGGGTAR
jgi:hypothetical protein